ncbi:hypothetical protein Tco_1258272 [Tanacetum coccineum]
MLQICSQKHLIYALTVNPTIYTSCIKQFWTTAKAKTVNGEMQIQALVDGKKVIVTETSVRRDLQLKDAEGIECLPNAIIFEQLTLMGYENLKQKLSFHLNGNFLSIQFCNALVLRLLLGTNLVRGAQWGNPKLKVFGAGRGMLIGLRGGFRGINGDSYRVRGGDEA